MTHATSNTLSANPYATPDEISIPVPISADGERRARCLPSNDKVLAARSALNSWRYNPPLPVEDGYRNPTPISIQTAILALQTYLEMWWATDINFPYGLRSVTPDGDGGVIIECKSVNEKISFTQCIYDDGTISYELYDSTGKLLRHRE